LNGLPSLKPASAQAKEMSNDGLMRERHTTLDAR